MPLYNCSLLKLQGITLPFFPCQSNPRCCNPLDTEVLTFNPLPKAKCDIILSARLPAAGKPDGQEAEASLKEYPAISAKDNL